MAVFYNNIFAYFMHLILNNYKLIHYFYESFIDLKNNENIFYYSKTIIFCHNKNIYRKLSNKGDREFQKLCNFCDNSFFIQLSGQDNFC